MDIDACIARLTGKDAKDAYAFARQVTAESRESNIWYPYFGRFTELLRHKNSLVRNRAISILAANAHWDEEGKFDFLLDFASVPCDRCEVHHCPAVHCSASGNCRGKAGVHPNNSIRVAAG